jgi:hypothetical protein
MFLFSLLHASSHPRILTLIIAFLHLHSLAFRLSPSHIAYHVKFNYYLIPHIIGSVTHPLTSLSSTSSSVFILIVFIIIDTASVSLVSSKNDERFSQDWQSALIISHSSINSSSIQITAQFEFYFPVSLRIFCIILFFITISDLVILFYFNCYL